MSEMFYGLSHIQEDTFERWIEFFIVVKSVSKDVIMPNWIMACMLWTIVITQFLIQDSPHIQHNLIVFQHKLPAKIDFTSINKIVLVISQMVLANKFHVDKRSWRNHPWNAYFLFFSPERRVIIIDIRCNNPDPTSYILPIAFNMCFKQLNIIACKYTVLIKQTKIVYTSLNLIEHPVKRSRESDVSSVPMIYNIGAVFPA